MMMLIIIIITLDEEYPKTLWLNCCWVRKTIAASCRIMHIANLFHGYVGEYNVWYHPCTSWLFHLNSHRHCLLGDPQPRTDVHSADHSREFLFTIRGNDHYRNEPRIVGGQWIIHKEQNRLDWPWEVEIILWQYDMYIPCTRADTNGLSMCIPELVIAGATFASFSFTHRPQIMWHVSNKWRWCAASV